MCIFVCQFCTFPSKLFEILLESNLRYVFLTFDKIEILIDLLIYLSICLFMYLMGRAFCAFVLIHLNLSQIIKSGDRAEGGPGGRAP